MSLNAESYFKSFLQQFALQPKTQCERGFISRKEGHSRASATTCRIGVRTFPRKGSVILVWLYATKHQDQWSKPRNPLLHYDGRVRYILRNGIFELPPYIRFPRHMITKYGFFNCKLLDMQYVLGRFLIIRTTFLFSFAECKKMHVI